jgi:DNA-binding NarL/FixJ family response regulator
MPVRMKGGNSMRIVIADDQGILRQGLSALIREQPDMEVVGEARDGWEAVALAKKLKPDAVVMDISMPNLNGVDATRQILAENPKIKVVALSMHPDRHYVMEILQAGALAYVLKLYFVDELIKALHAAEAGQHYLSPQITDVLVDQIVNTTSATDQNGLSRSPGRLGPLTGRQRQVLQLTAEGLSTKQIALRLCISPKTADANRREIMNELGIFSIAELTKYAIREGLTSAEF